MEERELESWPLLLGGCSGAGSKKEEKSCLEVCPEVAGMILLGFRNCFGLVERCFRKVRISNISRSHISDDIHREFDSRLLGVNENDGNKMRGERRGCWETEAIGRRRDGIVSRFVWNKY